MNRKTGAGTEFLSHVRRPDAAPVYDIALCAASRNIIDVSRCEIDILTGTVYNGHKKKASPPNSGPALIHITFQRSAEHANTLVYHHVQRKEHGDSQNSVADSAGSVLLDVLLPVDEEQDDDERNRCQNQVARHCEDILQESRQLPEGRQTNQPTAMGKQSQVASGSKAAQTPSRVACGLDHCCRRQD